jgi:hypothetical protein
MRQVCLSLALLVLFARFGAPEQMGSAIKTPIDQWRPVRPGTWSVKSTRSDSPVGQPPAVAMISACPYPSMLFLNNVANIQLGEPGCRYGTYKLSDQVYHIAAHCRALRGRDHFETTTLQVSDDGRKFAAATTWDTSSGSMTVQRVGELVADCKAK